jgi:L-ascorbate metabolism protein UlaG (beta-lactamase superfamily)
LQKIENNQGGENYMQSDFMLQHIRNATSLITINDKRILLDPMLSPKGTLPPVPFTRTLRKNPLVDLPIHVNNLIDVDAILLTHTHFDHFDKTAKKILDKKTPVFCQPEDKNYIEKYGFENVIPIEKSLNWEGIDFTRISGQHAFSNYVAKILGPVSGFILKTKDIGTIYIAGDCVYTQKIEDVFKQYQPNYAILNTPRAQMILGTVITMTAEDIVKIRRISPNTNILITHLDAISHCTFKRNDLRKYLHSVGLLEKVVIPEDGEIMLFS